jgi:hypothetical protein
MPEANPILVVQQARKPNKTNMESSCGGSDATRVITRYAYVSAVQPRGGWVVAQHVIAQQKEVKSKPLSCLGIVLNNRRSCANVRD